jgi:hypothetical protein
MCLVMGCRVFAQCCLAEVGVKSCGDRRLGARPLQRPEKVGSGNAGVEQSSGELVASNYV